MSHGQVKLTKNINRKWNESKYYAEFSLELQNGTEYDVAITVKEFHKIIKKSKKRASKNSELGKFKGYLARLFDKWN